MAAGDGTDGCFTARGITVDRAGRVYIAGGPNGIGTANPDLWVYSRSGELLAALRVPGDNVFLDDVWIGPDGAAYFTNSIAPQIFRGAAGGDGYAAELWADATGVIPTLAGFNLGGIVTSPDRSAYRRPGQRRAAVALRPGRPGVTPVHTGSADLPTRTAWCGAGPPHWSCATSPGSSRRCGSPPTAPGARLVVASGTPTRPAS